MARMTEKEAAYWDEYYTKNPPKPGPNGTGIFARRKEALAAHAAPNVTETYTITVDKFAADYLQDLATTAHKTPSQIICEIVNEKAAAYTPSS